jgi:hypothetical protein
MRRTAKYTWMDYKRNEDIIKKAKNRIDIGQNFGT